MEENQNNDTIKTKSKGSTLPIFIILFLVSLGLNLFLFFKYAKNGAELEKQNKELSMLYKYANIRADSLQQELDYAITQLQDKINENLAIEDLNEEVKQQYEAQLANLHSERRRLSNLIAQGGSKGGASPSKELLQAKTQIEELKTLNTEYIAKAEQTQLQYKKAKEEAEKNASTAKVYRLENDSLIEVTTKLKTKLGDASTLKIAGLEISPIRDKKGLQEVVEKASKLEQLRIYFEVLKSELTEQETKEISIRIIAPNGSVLTKNTRKLTNSDELVSLSENLDYDGSEKSVTYYYKQEAEYKKGKYKVEILNQGKLLDRTSFSLR